VTSAGVVRADVLLAALGLMSGSLGCGKNALSVHGGEADGALDSAVDSEGEAALDAADESLSCEDAGSLGSGDTYASSGTATCGGEVSIAGPTPFGMFIAKNVSTILFDADCSHLWLTFDDGEDQTAGFTGIWLNVAIPYDVPYDPLKSLVGTVHVTGFFNWFLPPRTSAERDVPVTLSISEADPLFQSGGLHAATADHGAPGHLAGTIDVDTGCGHVVGTFTVPYCREVSCIGPP
jgi:hypothetical protein